MSLVAKARTLAADLPLHRTAHDTHRRLDASVVASLRAIGALDALVPEELGGHEVNPATYIELLEALAIGDAATAWCTMTATTSTLLTAYVKRPAIEALWHADPPAPFIAGIFAPGGKLAEDGTGFRLTGKWSYASGCRHAEWFVVGALAGKRHFLCFVPKAAVHVVENWDTLGLAGTGSHDIAIERALVPQEHVTSVFSEQPWPNGALYRLPLFGLLSLGIAACALGVARSALLHVGARQSNDAPSPVLDRYAKLRGQLDAARAYVLSTAHHAYERAALRQVDVALRGELRLASSYATDQCAEVVRGAFHLLGGAAARAHHPVGNALRDIEMMTTHRMVQQRIWPAAARAMLGLDAVPPDL